jgi:hypothetical protein
MNRLHLGLAAVMAVAACGGSVVDNGTGGAGGTGSSTTGTGISTTGTSTTGAGASTTGTTTGAGAGTTGTGASTTGAGGSTSTGPCPLSPPTGSTSCAGVPDQFECTYGDSVRPDCRTAWICSNGTWTSTTSACAEPPPSVCGSSEPPAGTVCTNMGDVCTYGDSICFCGCGGGVLCAAPVEWQCNGPPTTPGCPAIAPNDGTACAEDGVQCTYGESCTPTNAVVACTNGLWLWNTMLVCG